MIKENLYESYTITFVSATTCPKTEHRHSFFELVFIRSGYGIHHLNDSSCGYKPGNLFLITPEDRHWFTIEQKTEFMFLRFNNIYLQEHSGLDNLRRIEYILHNANHHPECILQNIGDRSFTAPIVEELFREHTIADLYNQEMTYQLVNTLIVIVARNIAKYLPEYLSIPDGEKALDILQHIQEHIFEPEKLSAAHLSNKFAISETYLGRYFKRYTNETMQNYISKYKVKLIEHRLRFSNKRIQEIANEFNFTDVSHLNKFFKKQTGNTLKIHRALLQN
jgi:AraC-like DNA-binding protein